jgi:chemotaxis protein MotA
VKAKRRTDVASVAGLLLGVGCVLVGQALEGGTLRSVVQLTAAIIVFGGTLGATLVSFSRAEVAQAAATLRTVFQEAEDDIRSTAENVVRCARLARMHGLLALEDEAERMPDPLFQKALRLAVDGTDSRQVREIVEVAIANDEDRDRVPSRVFESLGAYAPTFGILGAVLGLIHVMQNLAEPAQLGAGIATAFVATVYGVGAANLVFLPIAAKLKHRADKRAMRGEMILDGVLAIQEGLSPRLVEEKLQAYLRPPRHPGPRVGRAA